ncbi:MAG: thioredoxin domain-containing protein [Candidatus Nitrosopelagicus sp.]|jgi:protein-disulfide isomerase|nr:thioredoxin domain-containing protein [Candidatus Nitrosopelagicus sp.]
MNNGSPKIGDNDAKISIVEFGDYQCTYCYKFHQNTLSDIQIQYIDSGTLNYVYRDFPLNGPDSILAAEASYCAADQEKYWQYHNLLFDNWAGEKTGWINTDSLVRFAINIELNIIEFKNCLSSHKYYQKVIDNENYAKKIGINATPSFLIFNDDELIRIIGAQQLEKFQNVIEQLTLK